MGTSIIEKSLADIERLIDEAKVMPIVGKTMIDQEELSRLRTDYIDYYLFLKRTFRNLL